MTWTDLARLRDRFEGPSDPAAPVNIAVLALLIVMLLTAGFSLALQWSVTGLQAPQVATAQD
jgi:hypothetical protein